MRRWLYLFVFQLLTSAVPAQSDLSFPQMIVGDSFETVVQISNDTAASDTILLEVFTGGPEDGAEGLPFPVRFNGGAPSPTSTFALAPFQEATVTLSLSGNLRAGWVRLRSTTSGGKVSAGLFYRIRSGSSVLDSVGVSTAKRYRFSQIHFDDREPGSATGVAFVNPDEIPVTIEVDLFQGERHLGHIAQNLAPKAHFAKLVSELFPGSGKISGTLVLEASANRAIPILTLRIDGTQLTSIPVRPFGFSLQYEIRNDAGELVESGHWVLDSEEFQLAGQGWCGGTTEAHRVTGTWVGKSFQILRREAAENGIAGVTVFNGVSAGEEQSAGAPILGKASRIGPDGQVTAVFNFSAFNKF